MKNPQQDFQTASHTTERLFLDEKIATIQALETVLKAHLSIDSFDQVVKKLDIMASLDQSFRAIWSDEQFRDKSQHKFFHQELKGRFSHIDKVNTQALKEIILRWDWPHSNNDASKNAFLIVQHADHDPDFQMQVLNKHAPLMPAKDAAYLYDRVAVLGCKACYDIDAPPEFYAQWQYDLAQSKYAPRQRYGTQGFVYEGRWLAYPSEDEANLDRRRLSVGLGFAATYAQRMNNQILHDDWVDRTKAELSLVR